MNVFWKIIKILAAILALLLICIGLYTFVPSFKNGLDSLVTGKKVAADDEEEPSSDADPGTEYSDPYVQPAQSSEETEEKSDVTYVEPETPREYLSSDIDNGYVSPSQEEIFIPDEMKLRIGGLESITPDIKKLSDERAKELEEELDYGDVGDGLEFDPLMYPYYRMLDDQSKHLYRQIYANACILKDHFKAVETNVTGTQLNNAFIAVFNDHPELFYLDTKFSAGYRKNGNCLEIREYYNSLAGNIEETRAQFEAAAQSVKNAAPSSPEEYEKAVHDSLTEMNEYSLAAPYNQSAYSALAGGSTVCAGYSRAFQYVMQLAGIPCYYCSGYAGESHAWNIICLDDEFYNVDVTWDDTDPGHNYDWYNKTDADYATTHMRKNLSVYLPPCNGTKYAGVNEEQQEPIEEEQPEEPPQDRVYLIQVF
ncbi:MAG: hypothetical protein K6G81_05890 [Lachnospiraceae bacterium]|nr:hypothetical protein [Lachnospiraceae bacterium]